MEKLKRSLKLDQKKKNLIESDVCLHESVCLHDCLTSWMCVQKEAGYILFKIWFAWVFNSLALNIQSRA